MAYNPAMYYPQMNSYGQQQYPVQAPQQPVQSYGIPVKGAIEWVDGEVGARAVQMPQGVTVPVALWDTNEPVIYVRSMNQMGMPNPMKKIRYTVEEDAPQRSNDMARLTSGETEPKHDMSEYVRKDELAVMKDELLKSIREIGTVGRHTKGETE